MDSTLLWASWRETRHLRFSMPSRDSTRLELRLRVRSLGQRRFWMVWMRLKERFSSSSSGSLCRCSMKLSLLSFRFSFFRFLQWAMNYVISLIFRSPRYSSVISFASVVPPADNIRACVRATGSSVSSFSVKYSFVVLNTLV